MEIRIVPVDLENKRLVRRFINLPFEIYRNIPQWVPPLEMDIQKMLDLHKNPFFRHSAAEFYLAENTSGELLGRLAVLDNRRHNEYNHTNTAFFYLFECRDDQIAAKALFGAAEAWARKRGLSELYGSKGFTALDGMGLLSRGFEHRPALGIPYNPAYYIDLVEAASFEAVGETVSGYIDQYIRFPEKVHEVARLVQERKGLRIARFRTRSDLRKLIPMLKEMYNAAVEGTEGNVPLTDEEVQSIASQMLLFADPKLIKIVMKDEQPVGFVFAYPDPSAAIQRCKGRLFPIGWLDVLIELRRTKWLNINGAGMIEGYRGSGGTALLFSELFKSILESRYDRADVVQIGVENTRMQNEMRNFGIDFYKSHRMYRKVIS